MSRRAPPPVSVLWVNAAWSSSGPRTLAELSRADGRDGPSGEDSRPQIVDDPTDAELVRSVVATWRSSLVEHAGGSSLADVEVLGDAVMDLTGAHPSGVAQLFAGRPTRLSNIFREAGGLLPVARRRARAVVARSGEYGQRYGVPATYLAMGVATWEAQDPTSQTDDVIALAQVTHRTGEASPAQPDDGAPTTDGVDGSAPETASDVATDDSRVPSGAAEVAVPSGPADSAGEELDEDGPGPEANVVRAPVLLRPITVRPLGADERDFELVLEPTAEINPLLARTLRSHGALLDPGALARSTFTPSGFEPDDALERLAALGEAVLGDFELTPRVLVGAFVHPGQMLVDDLDELVSGLERHEVVGAIAGSAEATRTTLASVPPRRDGDVTPAQERGAGDLDPSQRHVLDTLGTGSHLFVDAPAGSDVAGTVAAIVAEAAASGRSVLYVPGHRRSADLLDARLAELGLDNLVLDVPASPDWRAVVSQRLLSAMATEAEPPVTEETEQAQDALLGARSRLAQYIEALHVVREPWQVSAYDALQGLAAVTSARPAPSTQVRLKPAVTLAVGRERREEITRQLERAASLGAFTAEARDTPWAGAELTTDEAARSAVQRLERLVNQTVPQLRAQVAQVAASTGLEPAVTLDDWSAQLTMLGGMRGTLDIFLPEIFERAAADMVHATASRRQRADAGIEMSWTHRRRLRKQARDMVRPGVRVPDMHTALTQVAAQRAVWQQHCPRGGWPVLPAGLASIEDTAEAVRIDLDELAPVLAGTRGGSDLTGMRLDELATRLNALLADRAALDHLPQRTAILRGVGDSGLGDLLADLAAREVSTDVVGNELELAWWSSVFEQILDQDPALAGQDSTGLDALAERFRTLDRRHVESLSGPVRAAAREYLGEAMREYRDEAEALFTELIEGRLTSVRISTETYPHVMRRLRPCIVATPTLVPHIAPASRTVDVVILDSVQHTPVELVVSALARGRQIVVVGDPRTASGSAVAELSDVLPVVRLEPRPSRRDPGLTQFLTDHGYDGVLQVAPLPRPDTLLVRDLVDGRGMPDQRSGIVETTQAEVERVVEIAIDHALTRPDETFGIIAGTALHADRIRESLLSEVRANPALAPFFAGSRPGPVVVAGLPDVASLERDRIVLSLGLGRTPHGRVLHRFGQIAEPGGDAMLLGSLVAARSHLHLVTCLESSDLEPERLRSAGPRLLREVLVLMERRNGAQDQVTLGTGGPSSGPDRLVVDLADRLWREGLIVETDYGIDGGRSIPLVVGHPDLPGELLVAVLTDDAAYVAESSVRARDRLVGERLESLGWSVVQVWSAAAFLDPGKEAERIRRVVERARDARVPAPAVTAAPTSAPVPVVVDDTIVEETLDFEVPSND